MRKSDLAYFQKSKAYEEQQQQRIILVEQIDSLIKPGVRKAFRDKTIIKIGGLSEMGYIVKPVSFYQTVLQ